MRDYYLFIVLIISFFAEKFSISIWCIVAFYCMRALNMGIEGWYMDIIEDYPADNCVEPKKFQFLYKKFKKARYKAGYKGIPKEMYYANTVRIIGFTIYSILAIAFLLIGEKESFYLGLAYILISGIIDLAWYIKSIKMSFLKRFKKISIYNFRYILGGEAPYPKMRGKCKIVSEYKKGKNTYVTIKMIETGEIKEKVLLSGNKRKGQNPTYSLYEICKLFYII